VLGSDDALTFASLPGLPDLSSQPWPSLAWAGVPERSLLIAGAQNAGFFEPLSQLWLPGPTGLGGTARAVAPGGQSVAYLLATDGRLVRTMSAGLEPATVQLTQTRILVGASTRLTVTVRIGAPGVVLLRHRVPGRPWETARTASWTSGDWNRRLSFLLNPSLTHEYRLEFQYGKATVELAPAVKVVVTPKIFTARSRLDLRVGDVYRFAGSVAPRLRGARVGLFTDRGGSWRPVSLQGSVKLRDGRTWTREALAACDQGLVRCSDVLKVFDRLQAKGGRTAPVFGPRDRGLIEEAAEREALSQEKRDDLYRRALARGGATEGTVFRIPRWRCVSNLRREDSGTVPRGRRAP